MANDDPAIIAAFAQVAFDATNDAAPLETIVQALDLATLAVVSHDLATHRHKIIHCYPPQSASNIASRITSPTAHDCVLHLSRSELSETFLICWSDALLTHPQTARLTALEPYLAAIWKARPTGTKPAALGHLLHPDNPFNLTRAETRVCLMLAQGSRPQEIADGLGLSLATIRTHLSRIYGKSGLDGMFAVKHHLQMAQIAAQGDE